MAHTYLHLDPGEEILFTRRKHWINIFPIVVSTVLLLIFVAYALGWLLANTSRINAFLPPQALALVLLALGGLALLILIVSYFIYAQNRVYLTNRHYMQINQTGLFNRTVSKLTLDEIQDCKGSRKGFFATILGYGTILIETAGEDENFNFGPIADPLNVAELINDAHQRYGHRMGEPVPPPSTEPATPAPPPSV